MSKAHVYHRIHPKSSTFTPASSEGLTYADVDVQAFVDAVPITDQTIGDAINQLETKIFRLK